MELKAMESAISGIVFFVVSGAMKKYVNGVNITFKQIKRNALENNLKLGCFGVASNAVSLSSEVQTVPVTCDIARKVTEMITKATPSLYPSYVTQYAKRISNLFLVSSESQQNI